MRPRWRRLAWFVALYIASLAALAVAVWLLRRLMTSL
ncbi:MAG TPA: DUF2474 family protein [Gammaproteobacteria bacterium]|nr:DUF2474 family protein [Gammaproteobacteria bacterium]